jgi:DNA-binding XRE family transcriptional regulator
VVPGGQPTTQEGLAEICGVSADTIQRGEKGGTWSGDVFDNVATGLTESLHRTVKSQELKKHS